MTNWQKIDSYIQNITKQNLPKLSNQHWGEVEKMLDEEFPANKPISGSKYRLPSWVFNLRVVATMLFVVLGLVSPKTTEFGSPKIQSSSVSQENNSITSISTKETVQLVSKQNWVVENHPDLSIPLTQNFQRIPKIESTNLFTEEWNKNLVELIINNQEIQLADINSNSGLKPPIEFPILAYADNSSNGWKSGTVNMPLVDQLDLPSYKGIRNNGFQALSSNKRFRNNQVSIVGATSVSFNKEIDLSRSDKYFGLKYVSQKGPNVYLVSGINYKTIGARDLDVAEKHEIEYDDFGKTYALYEVAPQALHYVELPLLVQFSVSERQNLYGGVAAAWLVNASMNTQMVNDGQPILNPETNWGNDGRFTPYDMSVILGYNTAIFGRLVGGIEYSYGMTDVTKNNYYNNSQVDRTSRLRVKLEYKLSQF
jgi:hypothetical protein